MNGLMMNVPLTVTSIMRHAERFAGKTEIVSVSNDNPRYKYTYAEAFRRARILLAINALGGSKVANLSSVAEDALTILKEKIPIINPINFFFIKLSPYCLKLF